MKWLEITVTTTDAGLETVCADMNGAGMDGLSIEESRVAAAAQLEQNVPFWDFADMEHIGADTPCVKGYVSDEPESAALVDAVRAALTRLRTLDAGIELGSLEMTVRTVDDEDWENNWKQYYKPLPVGERLLVLPSWEPAPDTERTILKLDPGMAFGTGAHHTTRMCLELLESLIHAGDAVLDLGCGSGILSIASLLLGAKNAVAVDIDPIVRTILPQNVAMNDIDAARVSLHIGNVIADSALQAAVAGQYPVVVANIVADVIVALTPFARQCVRRGGAFVVSGVIDDRLGDVKRTLLDNGFGIERILAADDWNAILARG